MARLFLVPALVCLAAISVTMIGKIITETPAFSTAEQRNGVFGDWRVSQGPAMYHKGKYLFYQGLGFLSADETDAVESLEQDVSEDADPEQQRYAMAADLFRQSLALAPGQAKAWTTLAWTEALQGNLDTARSALETSWQQAPFNVVQAGSRLALTDFLSGIDESGGQFDALAEKSAIDDLRTLQLYRPTQFDMTLAGSERLRTLASTAGLTP